MSARDELARNPHATEHLLKFAAGTSAPEQAYVGAILNLAYEQRTANLLAFLDSAQTPLHSAAERDLFDQIARRLGLLEEPIQ